jgi:hypothetical protein
MEQWWNDDFERNQNNSERNTAVVTRSMFYSKSEANEPYHKLDVLSLWQLALEFQT